MEPATIFRRYVRGNFQVRLDDRPLLKLNKDDFLVSNMSVLFKSYKPVRVNLVLVTSLQC